MSNIKGGDFVSLCLRGLAITEDIDDFVDVWHDGDSELPLHEFLGFTNDEYSLVLRDRRYLNYILAARQKHQPLDDFLRLAANDDGQYGLAARAPSASAARAVISWLKEKGY